MSSANIDAMVRAGIKAYRDGNNLEARKLLEKAIELDDYNEQAWMWLRAVVETDDEKRTCLENVLVINPENEEAQRGLKMLGVDSTVSSTSNNSNASSSNPFTDTGMADLGDIDFMAGDDDWSTTPPTATSSASSTFTPAETSPGEYDNWVDNLGIGSNETDSSSDMEGADDSFDANPFADMFGIDEDEDIFGDTSDPFGSEAQYDNADDAFTSGPFGGDTFDDDLDERFTESITPAPSQPIMSPGAENIDSGSYFGEMDNSELAGGDFIVGDEAFQNDSQEDLTPDELFRFIPEEIKATHLPGTQSGIGVVNIVILVVLVLLNLVAVAFILAP